MNYCHNIYCRCVSTGLSEIDIFKMENECLVDELVELKKQKESIEKKEKATGIN